MTAQARRSFRPGGWFGIFGEHATVLLPPSEKARVAALWELVDEGAGFDETLDALLSTGLRDLPGFVLVSPVEHGTKVVLRGAAVAHFELADQTVEVAGSTDTTWVERLLTGVVRMSVQVEAAADDVEPLTIGTGLVRLARVDEPPVEEQSTEAPAEEPVSEEPAAEEPVADEPVADEPAAEEPATEEPVAEEPPTEEPVAEEPTPVGPVDLGDPGDPVPDPVPDDQPTEFLPPPAQHRALPEEPPGPERPVARLHFSSGQLVDVDRMVLVGRAPEAARYTLSDEPRVVQVASPHQEISATHLEVRPGGGLDRGSAVVTDLGSTNGTVLIQPGQVPQDLHPGIAVVLVPGAIIDLGDGISIQVEAV